MGINITIASCLAAAVIDINIYVMSNNEAIKSPTKPRLMKKVVDLEKMLEN